MRSRKEKDHRAGDGRAVAHEGKPITRKWADEHSPRDCTKPQAGKSCESDINSNHITGGENVGHGVRAWHWTPQKQEEIRNGEKCGSD